MKNHNLYIYEPKLRKYLYESYEKKEIYNIMIYEFPNWDLFYT